MAVQETPYEAVSPRERIVNLALHLTRYGSGGFATRNSILMNVHGYERYQDSDDPKTVESFRRTFENDKRTLREQGFVIETDETGECYRINMDRTFMAPLGLNLLEATELRAIGAAALANSTFPFKHDLRLALAKIAGNQGWTDVSDVDELQPLPTAPAPVSTDGSVEQSLREALAARKTVRFAYQSPGKEPTKHIVNLYGDFLYESAWYVVGFDQTHAEVRTFRVDRMWDVSINTRSAKAPDYQIPLDFKVEDYRLLPFQFGTEEFEGRFAIVPELAAYSSAFVRGKGVLTERGDGSLLWAVTVRNCARAASWCIETGPGVVPIAPARLVDAYRSTLLAAMGGDER